MESQERQVYVDVLLLALVAGCVDAVGFLQLGGFFVSFMSGNSTRLGVGLGSGYWREAGLAAGLIAIFVGGVAVGSLAGRRLGQRRRRVLLIFEGALLAVAAIFHRMGIPGGATVPMVLAMGIANSVFERDGDMRVGLAHVTATLVRVGQRIAAVADGGTRGAWKPHLSFWLAMVMGAMFGAQAYPLWGGEILWAPALGLLAMALVRGHDKPRPSPWSQGSE